VEPIWTQCEEKNLQPHQKLNPNAQVTQSIVSSSFHIDQNIVSLFFVDLMFGDYLIAADCPHYESRLYYVLETVKTKMELYFPVYYVFHILSLAVMN
jgi:hypothetical protein